MRAMRGMAAEVSGLLACGHEIGDCPGVPRIFDTFHWNNPYPQRFGKGGFHAYTWNLTWDDRSRFTVPCVSE